MALTAASDAQQNHDEQCCGKRYAQPTDPFESFAVLLDDSCDDEKQYRYYCSDNPIRCC